MPAPLVVLLYPPRVHGTGEDFCRAFAAAARPEGWRLHLEGSQAPGIARARELGAAAVVGPMGRLDLAREAHVLDLPVVNVYGGDQLMGLPQVGISDHHTGALAAQTCLDAGHRHVAYLGFRDEDEEGYVDSHRWAGIHSVVDRLGIPAIRSSVRRGSLQDWLHGLPKPCAVICVDDPIAARVILAADDVGLAVPDEIAVLGINDHVLTCELSSPPLASVHLGAERLGTLAAAVLRRQFHNPHGPAERHLLPPAGVAMRASMGISHHLPEPVRAALTHINADGWRHNDPKQVAAAVGRNRRVLDNLLRTHLDTTLFACMRRRQVAAIKHLLLDPDRSVASIARELDFSSPSYLGRLFRRETGTTPERWRGMMLTGADETEAPQMDPGNSQHSTRT